MIIIDDIDDQYLNWRIIMDYPINVGKAMINHPFGNGLYQLFVVKLGMVYYCFTHMN